MKNYEDLKQKIARLPKLTKNQLRRLPIHGYSSHRGKLNSCITLKQLEYFERKYRFNLPEDYRKFLLEIGNGGAGPDYGLLSLEKSLQWTFSTRLAEPFIPARSWHEYTDFQAPGILPISHKGCAYFDGLVITGQERGNIWQFVDSRPGWVPLMSVRHNEEVLDRWEQPFDAGDRVRQNDVQLLKGKTYKQTWGEYYDCLLSDLNRTLRLSFYEWYDEWLNMVLAVEGE